MTDLNLSAAKCLGRVREILQASRQQALQTVNAEMVEAYWQIEREIVEEEQRGQDRAVYGIRLIDDLAAALTADYGRGFIPRNLRYMREFYNAFPIWNALSSKSLVLLSWTHYRLLTRVQKTEARAFYAAECSKSRWSTRELERQISSLLYERLALSTDKAGVLNLTEQGYEPFRPEDLIKDPYVLEFTGIPQATKMTEADLELV